MGAQNQQMAQKGECVMATVDGKEKKEWTFTLNPISC